jgi:hypothetical protein
MKTWKRRLMLFVLMVGGTAVYAQQDREEVPGDHFSLQGALEVFKKSASPEEFERLLNSPDAGVNNLDLNGDGDIDYIRVIDRTEGNVHAFILQAVINERESQDVAVIELEKLANGKAVLQITGDADIYGIETIIEPTEEVRINAGVSTVQMVVNVWAWPSVQYVYGPYYSRWNSPWSWHHRPYWWNPWRPTTYIAYYPRWESYYPYYSVCHSHRIVYAQQIYRPYRNTSVIVYKRHHNQITNYRALRGGSDFNRGRENERNPHFITYQRNDRQGSNSLNVNSRSSVNNRREYTNDGNGVRSTSPRDNSVFSNRSDNVDRTPSSWQRNSGGMQRPVEKRSTPGNPTPVQRQRDNPSFGRSDQEANRTPAGQRNSSRDMQRPDSERRSNQINRNSALQHRETRQPSMDTRVTQRSSGVQPERRESSGNPAVNRQGNRDGSKSGGHRRGRD